MARRLLPVIALLGLVIVATMPAQQLETAPTLIVRIRSVDSMLADAKYLITLAGQKEVADQVDGLIKSMIGPKGFDGIDTKRPFGFYGHMGAEGLDSTGVVMVPIADQKTFLRFMDLMNLNPKEEGKGGLYRFNQVQVPVDFYLRFANNYAYVSTHLDADRAKRALAVNALLAPAKMFPASDIPAASLTIRIDQIPSSIKQLALQQFELKLAEEKNKDEPGESEAQKKLKNALIDEFGKRFSALVKDGSELSFTFDVDRKKDELRAEMVLTGTSGSQLAKDIALIGQRQSLFANVLGSDSGLNLLARVILPDDVKQAMAPAIDEGIDQGLKDIKDEVRRQRGEKFLEALKPTLKSGDFDFGLTVRGPTANKKYLVVLGARIQDGPQIEAALQQMLKGEKTEEQARFKWGVDKAGAVSINSIEIKKELDKYEEFLGKEPIYFAFRADAVVAAFGDGGLSALKEALNAKSGATNALQFNMTVRRFEPLLSLAQDEAAATAAREAFGDGKDNDIVRLSIEGGKSLRARFLVKGPVLAFLARVGKKD